MEEEIIIYSYQETLQTSERVDWRVENIIGGDKRLDFTRPFLTQTEQERFRSIQTQALRWTFLGSGMTHPNFLDTVGELDSAARTRIEEMPEAFC